MVSFVDGLAKGRRLIRCEDKNKNSVPYLFIAKFDKIAWVAMLKLKKKKV